MFGLKTALVALALLPAAAMAQGCVEDAGAQLTIVEDGRAFSVPPLANYTAFIGVRDLFNSNGVRLASVGAVLQQDRANFHKSGLADGSGGFSDSQDGYFTSLARRTALSTAPYYVDCNMTPAQERAFKRSIVNGEVQGVIWVLPFRHPRGGLGVYISLVN